MDKQNPMPGVFVSDTYPAGLSLYLPTYLHGVGLDDTEENRAEVIRSVLEALNVDGQVCTSIAGAPPWAQEGGGG